MLVQKVEVQVEFEIAWFRGHLTSGINDGDGRRQEAHMTSFDWPD